MAQHSILILFFSSLFLFSIAKGERITVNSNNASQTLFFVKPFSTGNVTFGGVSPYTQEQAGLKNKKNKGCSPIFFFLFFILFLGLFTHFFFFFSPFKMPFSPFPIVLVG